MQDKWAIEDWKSAAAHVLQLAHISQMEINELSGDFSEFITFQLPGLSKHHDEARKLC